jgi:dynein heavy chain
LTQYREICADLCKMGFSKYNMNKYFAKPTPEPLVFAQFTESLDDKLYTQFENTEKLTEMCNLALREYNELNAVMPLVLFEDAMKHVCKVTRIISAAQGHALMVGVGGSGKQSLSKLASFIC